MYINFLHLQISYTASSITLSDKRRFPTFLRTISSDNASIDIVSEIVREYGWEQMAIVTETNELFMNVRLLRLSLSDWTASWCGDNITCCIRSELAMWF